MQTIPLLQARAVLPAWRPAAAVRGPVLSQQAPPPPAQQQPVVVVPPPAPPEKPPFIDSAIVSSIQSFIGVVVTGLLAYGATYPGRPDVKPSKWTYVFLSLAAGLTVKGFADLSRAAGER